MTNSVRSGVGRRLSVLVGVAALVLAFGASTAMASVNLTPAGPYASTGSTAVTVYGTSPYPGATYVTVSVCNVASGVVPGTRCDLNSASPEPVSLASYEEEEVKTSVRRGAWQDWDFTKGAPKKVEGSTTTCKNQAGSATSARWPSPITKKQGRATCSSAPSCRTSFSNNEAVVAGPAPPLPGGAGPAISPRSRHLPQNERQEPPRCPSAPAPSARCSRFSSPPSPDWRCSPATRTAPAGPIPKPPRSRPRRS